MKENCILGGQIIAFISFIIGTSLFSLLFYIGEQITLMKIGLGFVSGAFLINMIMLIVLILIACFNKNFRIEIAKTIGIMLLNIPISIFYFYLLLHVTFSIIK